MPAETSAPQQSAKDSDATDRLVTESVAIEYISKKVVPQQRWFDRKATRAKFLHYSLLGISMVATTFIILANSIHLPILSSTLALIATMATGATGLLKFQENWIRYRSAANALEHSRLKYEIGAPPFNGPDRHGLIIQEAEKVFVEEQSQWAAKISEAAPRASIPIH
jgi:hypothetical protein